MDKLLDIPLEIQREILSYLCKPDLANVRRCCKTLSQAANIHFFRIIKVGHRYGDSSQAFMKEMSQDSGAAITTSARKLDMFSLSGADESIENGVRIQAHMMEAIKRMTALATVSWDCLNTPWWMREPILLALSKHESIKKLTLRGFEFGLKKNLTALRSLELRSLELQSCMLHKFTQQKIISSLLVDQLQLSSLKIKNILDDEYLELGSAETDEEEEEYKLDILTIFKPYMEKYPGQTSSIAKLFLYGVNISSFPNHLQQALRNVTSLEIYYDEGEETSIDFDALWNGLRLAGQHLTKLGTNNKSISFIKYLRSYNGLCKLSLCDRNGVPDNPRDQKTIMRSFWLEVVPQHNDTLKTLILYDIPYKIWTFGIEAMGSLFRCTALRQLAVDVDSVQRAQELITASSRFPAVLEWLYLDFTYPTDEWLRDDSNGKKKSRMGVLQDWLETTKLSSFHPNIIAITYFTNAFTRVLLNDGWGYQKSEETYYDIDKALDKP